MSAFAQDVALDNKLETALTCRAVATYLREKFPDDERLKICEEASLAAIVNSIKGLELFEARLLIRELPDLLSLPYPVVKDIRHATIKIIPQMINFMRLNDRWKECAELDYLQRMLKNFKE